MSHIEALLQSMTLDEKVGQLTMVAVGRTVTGPVLAGDSRDAVRAGRIGSLLNLWGPEGAHEMQRIAVDESRLGIPLILGFDVVHGHRTIFPIPLGEAALFDPVVWERTAREAAVEAAADGIAMTFAPMLDIARDPRWGRIAESPGEDPLVGSRMAEAKVRGFQGGDLAGAENVAATAKHFCAYGAPTAGRDYASVDISERTLHEVHLPPFQAALAAGTGAIMPAFNDIAGVPMTANAPLLRGWLREKEEFSGVLVSDYNAIAELLRHGVAADVAEAAALALNAGVDIDMMGSAYRDGLATALQRGLVDAATVDAAVLRVLALKERLGLFEDPYRRGSGTPPDAAAVVSRRVLARLVGSRAIVLLSHQRQVLPIAASTRRIALIGPLAQARADMLGSWAGAGEPDEAITIEEGLKAALPGCRIDCVPGVLLDGGDRSGMPEALDAAREADLVILCLGEASAMSGEAASRATLDLPGRQRELAEAVLDLRRPTVALLSSGRPLAIAWLVKRADAVLATWFLGSEAGNAVADILTGIVAPSGRLPITWPYDVGQSPIYFAQRPSGRPANPSDHYTSKYLDMLVEPLFPFGHGLSYSETAFSNLRATPLEVHPGSQIEVTIDVANQGAIATEETVFLFIRDPVASIARPVLELKDWSKVKLQPAEKATVSWMLPVSALGFLGADLEPVLEPGAFEILAGSSADRSRLQSTTVTLVAGS